MPVIIATNWNAKSLEDKQGEVAITFWIPEVIQKYYTGKSNVGRGIIERSRGGPTRHYYEHVITISTKKVRQDVNIKGWTVNLGDDIIAIPFKGLGMNPNFPAPSLDELNSVFATKLKL